MDFWRPAGAGHLNMELIVRLRRFRGLDGQVFRNEVGDNGDFGVGVRFVEMQPHPLRQHFVKAAEKPVQPLLAEFLDFIGGRLLRHIVAEVYACELDSFGDGVGVLRIPRHHGRILRNRPPGSQKEDIQRRAHQLL